MKVIRRFFVVCVLALTTLLLFAASAIAETEPANNRFTGADGPLANGVNVNAGLSAVGDEDWYYFYVAATGDFTVSNTAYTVFYQYDGGSLDEIWYMQDGGVSTPRQLQPGLYYIRVYKDSPPLSYTLRVSGPVSAQPPSIGNTHRSATAQAEIYEEAETGYLKAQPVAPYASNLAVVGATGDTDWYKFNVSRTCDVTVGQWAPRGATLCLYDDPTSPELVWFNSTKTASKTLQLGRGTYYVMVDGWSPPQEYTFTIQGTNVTLDPLEDPVAGTNRFTTAVEASKKAYPAGAATVVIATGRNWPDALGGSSLAGVLDGPILLVDTNAVPAEVSAEITRLNADKAIILGGTSAVSGAVEATLKTQIGAADVTRIAGSDRYKTADAVASQVIALAGSSFDGTAFVATGGKFPDALGAAPLAAAKAWPLYLAHPANGLSAGTKAAMTGVKRAVILGGTAVVSSGVETYLKAAYPGQVTRLNGADRYETAVKVATYGVDHAGLKWNRVAIATGINFPDALAGGVLQGRVGSVMLLTKPDALNAYTSAALSGRKAQITTVTFFGGTGALPQVVRDQVSTALE